MAVPIFIGDELTASGFRLAGARIETPETDQAEAALRDALQQTAFVVITASIAAELPRAMLEQALQSRQPLLAVVPDAAGVEPPNLAREIYRRLGISG